MAAGSHTESHSTGNLETLSAAVQSGSKCAHRVCKVLLANSCARLSMSCQWQLQCCQGRGQWRATQPTSRKCWKSPCCFLRSSLAWPRLASRKALNCRHMAQLSLYSKAVILRVQMNSWESGICVNLEKCKAIAKRKCLETPLLKGVGSYLGKTGNLHNQTWRHRKCMWVCSWRDVGHSSQCVLQGECHKPWDACGTIF